MEGNRRQTYVEDTNGQADMASSISPTYIRSHIKELEDRIGGNHNEYEKTSREVRGLCGIEKPEGRTPNNLHVMLWARTYGGGN